MIRMCIGVMGIVLENCFGSGREGEGGEEWKGRRGEK
tara:strand:+ start:369 stop:479 length:111 start_codon:yes stop_codon:yes gene_type:complete